MGDVRGVDDGVVVGLGVGVGVDAGGFEDAVGGVGDGKCFQRFASTVYDCAAMLASMMDAVSKEINRIFAVPLFCCIFGYLFDGSSGICALD